MERGALVFCILVCRAVAVHEDKDEKKEGKEDGRWKKKKHVYTGKDKRYGKN